MTLCVLRTSFAAVRAQDRNAALDAVQADEARRVTVYDSAAKAVVCVFTDESATSGGSGVVIDEQGYGLTNFHVVADFLESRRGFGGLADGRLYPLRVLGVDPGGDIAMFKLEGRERFDAAQLGDSDGLCVGQWVAAMGNPFLLAEDFSPTITQGIISGLHRYQYGQGERGSLLEYADCIQVSTSINPGNSGGPLFDMSGRVIGINGRASFDDGERGRVNVGLGYAVSINQIKRFLPALRAGQLCEHGTLGATVRLAGNDLIFDAIQGLSAAERAGVQLGDELVRLDGRRARTPNDVNNILTILPTDWPITITLRRNGEELAAATRLDPMPLRMPQPYVLDLEHNHAEIRNLLKRLQSSAAQTLAEPRSCRIKRTAGDQTTTTDVTLSSDGTDVLVVQHGAEREVFRLKTATFVDDPGPPHADDWRSRPVWSEWQHITAPLLHSEIVTFGWELVGGDKIRGRISSIVEWRVADGQQVRWAFDYETGRLLEARVFDARHPGAAVWLPDGGPGFSMGWRRETGSGATFRIELTTSATEGGQ